MKVIKVTKEYFQTEDEKVYFFEPLEKVISIKDMQKIVDVNKKLLRAVNKVSLPPHDIEKKFNGIERRTKDD